jgi:hypothetical protein
MKLALSIVFAAFFVCGVYAQASDYEKLFQKGLQEETGENWSAAIQYYLQAMEAEPDKPFPRIQIEGVFKRHLMYGKSIDSLRTLLPPELENDMQDKGVFLVRGKKPPQKTPWMNYAVWALIISVLGAGGFFFFMKMRANIKEQEAEEAAKERPKNRQRRPVVTSEQPMPSAAPRPQNQTGEVKVTEKTRAEMDEMITGLNSLTQHMRRPDWAEKMKEEDEEQLKDSGVVKALAETLISEVQIKEAEDGKLSKMTLDGSLLFEEEDVNFFEKEFGATKDDIESSKTKPKKKKVVKKIIKKKVIKKVVRPKAPSPEGDKPS